MSTNPNRFEVDGDAIIQAVFGRPQVRQTINKLGREIASEARHRVAAVGASGDMRDMKLTDIYDVRKLNYKGIQGQGTAPRNPKIVTSAQTGSPVLARFIKNAGANVTGLVVSNSGWSRQLEYGTSSFPVTRFMRAALEAVSSKHPGTVVSRYSGRPPKGSRP